MIKVNHLKKEFFDKKRGKIEAVNDINFHCHKNQIFGLLGPNGAGKTTTLRILATMMKPTAGEVLVNGYQVVKEAHKVRQSIGFLSGRLVCTTVLPREKLYSSSVELMVYQKN